MTYLPVEEENKRLKARVKELEKEVSGLKSELEEVEQSYAEELAGEDI